MEELKATTEKTVNADLLSPLSLAFVGDAVFDLYIRESLVINANRPAKKLHENAVACVRAEAQAQFVKKIEPLLTEKEYSVFRRGKNAHTNHIPKNASQREYHDATGFEALVGWLHLSGQTGRLLEILAMVEVE